MNKQQLEKGRKGETIGGGFFVFRRGKHTGRVGVRLGTLPFEHGSFESAATEARRLAEISPGETFSVFEELDRHCVDKISMSCLLRKEENWGDHP
jgi:hypothetical protein